MEFQLRVATISDAQLISDLSKQTFYEAFIKQTDPADMELFLATNFSLEGTLEEFENGKNTFFLAYKDEQVCGYANIREGVEQEELMSQNTLLLARIYVLDVFIDKGVGKLLMNHCLAVAKERNKEFIWLSCWEHNPKAINFYHTYGFEKFGDEVFILGNDHQTDWLLKKKL